MEVSLHCYSNSSRKARSDIGTSMSVSPTI